ncbi:MAG: hypothetical protein COU47_03305 [Candidatus Niyogibacteria bacterium CG10_big_fil_rev_8_21_14_0_10_46_36]|uniref:Uncharacterized protein n=1 Tax=Candidatus Niyogibacteria bacterium CG10_big_fil_rev_8_21_14_0_10_46_36 TaxID=1974726 RepID=A0A2H0TCU5_9BACT|nr:MAG: hypothetical protein COU47_03305 [Candidatus Niyogibacteria bacterium CG10_big_fil_rev_8_21_14_0_10_46_36]
MNEEQKKKRSVVFWVAYAVYYVITFFTAPWFRAKLYLAWDEYQEFGHYRERVSVVDVIWAMQHFFADKWERQYYYRQRIKRYPRLRWLVLFTPWIFEKPAMFDLIVREGLTKKVLREV